ncbi:type IV toxin-antitoxin system AbiEi family antitoxin domain-containing protein [Mycobacterium neumannii]|uniref:type IV toxin-antitoxin system AbiEi family antitoxin domain-containing protein n=1 Tax=Mycobacterium neumannii TaxID=2048551 RepID=UPI003AB5CB69
MLNDHLRRHDGVLTLSQARLMGMSRSAVHRRVRSGLWRQCARGVYFVDDRPFSDAARIRVGVWSCGETAVASGLTAAWWHSLTRFAPNVVEVTMPRNGSGRAPRGVRLRRRNLASEDIVECKGLRVTSRPLTVLEAAVRTRDGAKIMDRALQADVALRDLWRAQLRNNGRYGSPSARVLLQAASDGARSTAERLLLRLLREAGITGWQANYPVGRYRVDVGFKGPKVAIEVDGLAFHIGSDEFHQDRVRQNHITLLGWQVLRFTWLDLTEYPDRVIALIKSAISM